MKYIDSVNNSYLFYLLEDSISIEILEALLNTRKININHVDNHGKTILHYLSVSTSNIRLSKINLLIKFNIDINKQDKLGKTSLMYACEYGSLLAIETLLQYNVNLNIYNLKNENHLTLACINNQIDVIMLFILNGIDVNTIDNNHNTMIMIACKYNHHELIEFLLEKSADISLVNNNNETVFTFNKDTYILKLLNDIKIKKLIENKKYLEICIMFKLNITYVNDSDIIHNKQQSNDNVSICSSDLKCNICFDNNNSCYGHCKHKYCISCYLMILKDSKICAYCRTPFIINIIYYIFFVIFVVIINNKIK